MTDDLDLDDLEAHDDEQNPEYVRIRKDDLTQIRKAARARGQSDTKLREELATYKRRDTIREAGLTDLTDKQVAALARLVDEETPEAFKTTAAELGWTVPDEPDEETAQREAEMGRHSETVTVANGAKPATGHTQTTADELATWPVDKLRRFDEQHPELYNLALQGQPISVPAGFN